MTTQADRADQLDPGSRDARVRASSIADQWTRRAILDMVRESGGQISERPIYQGSSVSRPDAEPMAALGTIRYVEAAARHNARRYIRDAREAGHGWHGIGAALGLTGGTGYGETVAEAAYTYAAGDLDSAYARSYGRSFTWTCPSCDGTIHDRGPYSGPENDEEDHARDCPRLAAVVAAFDAQWEAEA